MRPRRTAFEHSENGVLDPVPLYGQRTESPQIARKATERGEISRRRAFFCGLLRNRSPYLDFALVDTIEEHRFSNRLICEYLIAMH